MNSPLVSTQKLCKTFRVYNKPSDRFLEWVLPGQSSRHVEFHALTDVTFTVNQGECVGLIGPNGAGKSTLLRILSSTLEPTSGSFAVAGRALSLLELGTGFNAELTGRQNVANTAQLLGLPAGYGEEKFADIEAFADLGAFIDRPVRTYSSGMALRLAFSMFAFFEPDVLIVDEALAVGDAAFQRKCFRRMEEFIGDAKRAVILVSHDLQSIVRLCTRVYWMDQGVIRQAGDPQTVVQAYLRHTFAGDVVAPSRQIPRAPLMVRDEARRIPADAYRARSPAAIVYPVSGVELLGLWLEDHAGPVTAAIQVDEPFFICYALRFHVDVQRPVLGFRITTTRGEVMIATNTQMQHVDTPHLGSGQAIAVRWPVNPGLEVADYFVSCGCSLNDDVHQFLMREVDGYQFSITGERRQSGLCCLSRTPAIRYLDASHDLQAR